MGNPKFRIALIDLPRRRAFLDQERGFAHVVEEHPVPDEAEGVAREHAPFYATSSKAPSAVASVCGDDCEPRTTSSNCMMLAGAKKCKPTTLPGREVAPRDRIDVEGRRVRCEDRIALDRFILAPRTRLS